MIASWSPFTRRVVALGILLFVTLGAINIVIMPVSGWLTNTLEELSDGRFRLARLRAIEARPPLPDAPPVPQSLYLTAPDRDAAAAAMIGSVGAAAARTQVSFDQTVALPADPSGTKLVSVGLAGTGAEEAVLLFVNELERGPPVMRLRTWRLTSAEGQPRQVRIEAIAVAVWSVSR